MKRRAERTYFNTECMTELYEDSIESDDPLEIYRMTHGGIGDVVNSLNYASSTASTGSS